MQDSSERLEHLYRSSSIARATVQRLRNVLLETLTTFLRYVHRYLHTVVCGFLQQEEDQLQHKKRVGNSLVHEMGDEARQRDSDELTMKPCYKRDFIVPSECASELEDHSLKQKLAYFWQLRVHNGDEGGVDVGEAGRRQLRLHQRSAEQSSTPHQVLLEEFGDDVADVHHVHLVDDAVQRLAKRLPSLPLVLRRRLVLHIPVQSGQFEGRNVHASSTTVDDLRCHQCRCFQSARSWSARYQKKRLSLTQLLFWGKNLNSSLNGNNL